MKLITRVLIFVLLMSCAPAETPVQEVLCSEEDTGKLKRVITYGTFDVLHYGHINLWFKSRLACRKKGKELRYTDEKQIYKMYAYFREQI